jgi:hypothetical protein
VALEAAVCLIESAPPPRFLRADANQDGKVDISDAIFTLDWLFLGGPGPACRAAASSNGDGAIDIADAIYLLGHLFLGDPSPPAPFPECGPGELETDRQLGCEAGTCL